MKPQSFKARDYLFAKGVLAESLISAGLLAPKKCSYFRVPKLAVNGRCISADFKARKGA
jgi:hypothetical protein